MNNPPFTSDYDTNPEPLYAEGTGRVAMDGTFSGIFIGHFAQIKGKFPAGLDDATYLALIRELKKQQISVTWYDLTRMETRTSDFRPSITNVGRDLNNRNKELEFLLTAIRRD